jgi:hypothetical protein
MKPTSRRAGHSRLHRLLLLSLLWTARLLGAPETTGWIPLFKGVDYMIGTNSTSSGDFTSLMVAHILRVDLTDPDVRLLPTPPHTNYLANQRETAGRTVSQFVKAYGVQVAVNANFFSPTDYYLPEGTAMRLDGLSISDGFPVSPANQGESASVLFDVNRTARIVHTNWPAGPTNGVLHAVSGDYPILVAGRNISRAYLGGGNIHEIQPRTAFGVSRDGTRLFLICIDGRQAHSIGAYDYETAAWMLLAGAHDAVNMDGGGSATMVMQDSLGQPLRLNASSAVADSGRERTVGGHFGVFAKPVVGFVNDIAVTPSDDGAVLRFTTTAPAVVQVAYGTNNPPDRLGTTNGGPATSHTVRLGGLVPGTGYYFRVVAAASADGARHESTVRFFTTTRTVETLEVVPLAASWRHTTIGLDGVGWTSPGYNDSAWSGPDRGVLWVNTSAAGTTLDREILGGELLPNFAAGLPFVSYYLRTRFNVAAAPAGATFAVEAYIDDGAVFHLNGRELHRVRMPEAPAEILRATLATGTPCSGNATCTDTFTVPVDGLLVPGENVLAVEVHNASSRSSDITFGARVVLETPVVAPPVLRIVHEGPVPVLEWSGAAFRLQQADSPAGPWTDVPGSAVTSPHRITDTAATRWFRLAR